MSDLEKPINVQHLVALADAELDAVKQRQVEDFIAVNPDAASQVAAYRQQREALHRVFDASLAEPIPEHLLPPTDATLSARLAAVMPLPGWRVAAACAWIAVGGALGWTMKDIQTKPMEQQVAVAQSSVLVRQASVAYAVYAPEILHPVEVRAREETHLTEWLSKRLGKSLKVPSLTAQGFALVGGRLLPAEPGRAAAQFMYESRDGQRLTLYLRAMEKAEADTSFRYALENGVGVFYWIDRDWGYALSGQIDRKKLLTVAETAYRQFNNPPGK